jgi:acetyl esterase/lipase
MSGWLLTLLVGWLGLPAFAQPRQHLEVTYKTVDTLALKLDIFLPDTGRGPFPVVVWVHGGGWRVGSKAEPRPRSLTEQGFAVASISYRLSQVAKFPAQLIDCKDAVRFLRHHAATYQLDPNRIAAWGSSAGGHLVALLATTAHHPGFAAPGPLAGVSDGVQAAVDECGPTDMVNYVAELTALDSSRDWNAPSSYIYQLFGAPPARVPTLARQASALFYADARAAPMLILHGMQDNVVPPVQSQKLHAALQQKGATSTLKLLPHDNHAIKKAHIWDDVTAFLHQHLGH